MNPTVTVDASEAVRFFGDRVRSAEDLRPAFDRIVEDFYRREAEVFASQGRSIGTPWKPLAPAYAAWRRQTGRGGDLLRYSSPRGGLLFRSLTQPNGPQQRKRLTRDGLEIGTRVGIAGPLQRGMSRTDGRGRRRTIPARPMVNVDRRTAEAWTGMLISHLLEP